MRIDLRNKIKGNRLTVKHVLYAFGTLTDGNGKEYPLSEALQGWDLNSNKEFDDVIMEFLSGKTDLDEDEAYDVECVNPEFPINFCVNGYDKTYIDVIKYYEYNLFIIVGEKKESDEECNKRIQKELARREKEIQNRIKRKEEKLRKRIEREKEQLKKLQEKYS